jgi:hypothetical protein
MNNNFEWMRIALAMGLMGLACFVLPAFFPWRDKPADDRQSGQDPDARR